MFNVQQLRTSCLEATFSRIYYFRNIYFHSEAMSSSGGGVGSTLTGGVQDISAILPLLGTEQCSDQVSSALTRGYLYAASAPMSIFGSLGVVIAGFKTLVACFSFGDIEGAKILGNMGFEPQGENLALIMVDAGKGKNSGCYIIETRMDELIKELHIDKNRITGVSHKSVAWNVKMVATTALLCAFSIAPYIYLNRSANSLKKSTIWIFPVLRATGGFVTATLIQLLIQRRITFLSDQFIKRHQLPRRNQLRSSDVEAADDAKKQQMVARHIVPTSLLLCLLFIGLAASVVGYVGCFSVVQNSTSTLGPISWLCLEGGLSIVRLAIWAWNPTRDDAPPLEIILELDKYEHNPLPTCNKYNEEILQYKVLPLTRSRAFLRIITSFAELIEPFNNPDLSFYYTLTRKRPSKEGVSADIEKSNHQNTRDNGLEPENAEKHKPGERTLYITVFDHKERTTRVYTRDNEIDTFYSTKSHAPRVDIGHVLLEVEIDAKIDPKCDPVYKDSNNLDSLRKHHRLILEHVHYRLGAGDVTEPYAIENSWTMKVEDTVSTLKRLREENRDVWNTVVEKGKEEERNEGSYPNLPIFMHASIERDRRLLDEKRVKWIARRMRMITKETKERFEVEYRVNKQAVEKKWTKLPEEIEEVLFSEWCLMELLLLYEVMEWERLFWNRFKAFLDQIQVANDRVGVEVKERWTREWRAHCWKRLNPQMQAAVERLVDLVKDKGWSGWFLKVPSLSKRWASSISQLIEGPGVEISGSMSLSELRKEMEHVNDEIRLRMEREIEDTEFRLKRGYDLGRFDQFWDDDSLFECRYSRSKWLYLSQNFTAPLEIYSHALKGNENIIHITSSLFEVDWFQATICDLPWVTSVASSIGHLPAIHRHGDVPLFIKSTDNDLITFAKEIRLKLDSFSTYIFTDAGDTDMYPLPDRLGNNAKVLISFVAPSSGQCLILRLTHSGREDGPLEVSLGSTTIQLNPSCKSSLTIDEITLYPIPVHGPSEFDSNLLSFEPGIRNDIFIQFRRTVEEHGHLLHDIELLDGARLEDLGNSRCNLDSLSILSTNLINISGIINVG